MKLFWKRYITQFFATLLGNGYIKGFLEGKIFQGKSKYLCLPGLNCYSCPGALGSCPIGSLQATLNSFKYKVSLYVSGIILLFGMALGRWICGWLCPFGFIQDLLYRIPSKKVRVPRPLRWLKYLKYVVLVVMVILLPALVVNVVGQGDPWFCKYICPSGTVMGAFPLLSVDEGLRTALGPLFWWKVGLAVAILVSSVFLYRTFCRFLCPLGALYGLLNKVSLYRMRLIEDRCIHCGACERACDLDINPMKTPNSAECIRCGDCRVACPTQALQTNIRFGQRDFEMHDNPRKQPRRNP